MAREASSGQAIPAALGHVDPQVQEILSHRQIRDLIQENQGKAQNIVRAAELLHGKENAAAGVAKAAAAIVSDSVNVFFSYKQAETTVARKVIDVLQSSTGRLNISFAEDWDRGIRYRERIESDIHKANWFILLLPDPSLDWDWPLFESGLFTAQMLPGDKVFCLHHPDINRPKQLEEFNSIKADQGEVERFLKQILWEDDAVPGMDALNRNAMVEGMATMICDAIKPPLETPVRTYFDNFVAIEPAGSLEQFSLEDLMQAKIVDNDKHVGHIFFIANIPETFGKLVRNVVKKNGGGKWLEELSKAIREGADGGMFEPIQATFREAAGGKLYRPVLYKMDKWKNGKRRFTVLFIESLGRDVSDTVPKGLATLATALRLTHRFRWELIDKFEGKNDLSREEIAEIEDTLNIIEKEAESRGLLDPELLSAQFDGDAVDRILEMFEHWGTLRNPETHAGVLDKALAEDDAKKVLETLAELRDLNQEFLVMAARRFADCTERLA